MWQVRVPATSANLGSGLDTLALAVSLFLTIKFEARVQWSMEITGHGAGTVEANHENLVWRSADLLYRHVEGRPMPNGHLVIDSEIPLGKGLGSSAAASVAGLVLANQLVGQALTLRELLQFADRLEGHADNAAAALYGGFVMVWRDHGNSLQVRRYPAPPLDAILAVPPYPVSTPQARQLLPNMVPRHDAVFNAQRVGLWIHAVTQNDWTVLRDASEDRLHQTYRAPLNPDMDALIHQAIASGAYAAVLSGSGPTVLALSDTSHVAPVTHTWQGSHHIEVIHTTLCNQGAAVSHH
ncbi:MAG: homoserine kinase [Sulfobacillus benefaciens]|uniref:Homoserine kinase n=1 Tax=Sulfobacillus benefaciens TaxID=453960 RepID=A0A2T2XG22_9FIRM|nr:MAG: homoserine kinase [Sulfobacillus benefaciens]